MSDHNLVSQEDHELNYILRRYGFEQSKKNRERLSNMLKNFKKYTLEEKNRPHFYEYLETTYEIFRKQAEALELND